MFFAFSRSDLAMQFEKKQKKDSCGKKAIKPFCVLYGMELDKQTAQFNVHACFYAYMYEWWVVVLFLLSVSVGLVR